MYEEKIRRHRQVENTYLSRKIRLGLKFSKLVLEVEGGGERLFGLPG